ncbi:MAG: glycosyltransferase family A protein, partial [Sulfurimonadaceae bacterium]
MKSNKISVIIPTYNRGDLIERALKSVLEQDYHDLEVIIV